MATSPASSANSGGSSIPSLGIHGIMNRKATLQNQEKEFVTSICNLLTFKAGTWLHPFPQALQRENVPNTDEGGLQSKLLNT
jgi:hypothetical protein